MKQKMVRVNDKAEIARLRVIAVMLAGMLLSLAFLLAMPAHQFAESEAVESSSRQGPIPQPTPVNAVTLTIDSGEELKINLLEIVIYAVEDEDTIYEIADKWVNRDLDGLTMSKALELLMEDVRAVLRDPELSDEIWEEWQYELGEANTGTDIYEGPYEDLPDDPDQTASTGGMAVMDAANEPLRGPALESFKVLIGEETENSLDDFFGIDEVNAFRQAIQTRFRARDLEGKAASEIVVAYIEDARASLRIEDEGIKRLALLRITNNLRRLLDLDPLSDIP